MTSVDEWQEEPLLPEDGFTPFPIVAVTVSSDVEAIQQGQRLRVWARGVLSQIIWLTRDFGAVLSRICLDRLSSVAIEMQRFRLPTDEEWHRIERRPGIRYYTYLESEQWQQRRQFMLRRAGYRCQICNGRGNLQVHHRTYERVGAERIDDLTVLCADCHKLFHHHRRVER